MPHYTKGDVTIRYEETGSGFPLLATPGGGLNSKVENWPNQVFDSMEVFKGDFRVITMDQRNAIGGESAGPVQVDDRGGPSPTTSSALWTTSASASSCSSATASAAPSP